MQTVMNYVCRALEKRLNQLVVDFEAESDKRKQKENEVLEVQSQLSKTKVECKEVSCLSLVCVSQQTCNYLRP